MEKLMTLFERFVVAVEKIASTLAAAATVPTLEGSIAAPVATTAPETKAKKGKGKKEEAAAPAPDTTLPSIESTEGDDFGGETTTEEDEFGTEEQAATASREDALAAIRDLALRKGRDTAAALLLQVSGCKKTSEIEAMPNAAQIFGALVIAAKKLV